MSTDNLTKSSDNVTTTQRRNAMSPFEDMDRVFDQYFAKPWSPFKFERPEWPSALKTSMPNVDIIEKDNEIAVRAELPGVDKKDIDISVTENTISIKGQTKKEEKVEDGEYYRREISQGSFMRTLSFPCEVDSAQAKASFKDGMLEVIIPKTKESHRHKIEVK